MFQCVLEGTDAITNEVLERVTFVLAYPTVYTRVYKAIPLQARTGPEGSRRLRLPDFKTIGTLRW